MSEVGIPLIAGDGERANAGIAGRIGVDEREVVGAVYVHLALLAADHHVRAVLAHGDGEYVLVLESHVVELRAVGGEEGQLVGFVDHAHALGVGQHVELRGFAQRLDARLELLEQLAVHGVHEHRSVLAGADDQAELAADHHADDLTYVAGEYGARTGILVGLDGRQVLVDDGRSHAVPDPDHDGGVARAGGHEAVAVLRHLRAAYARDQVVVGEHDLHDLGRVGAEHAEALVAEARRQYVPIVVGAYEVGGRELPLLVEVLAELATMQRRVERQQLVHDDGQLLQLAAALVGVYRTRQVLRADRHTVVVAAVVVVVVVVAGCGR